MRVRWIAVLGVLCLLALLLWRVAPGAGSGASPAAESDRVGPEIGEVTRTRAVGLRLEAVVIAGRVRVADGALPPAQVCAVPAEIALDRGGWARLSTLAALERCVAVEDDGHYRIDGLLPGRWVVSASADGYLAVQHRETPTEPWITLRLGDVREGLDFTLRVRGAAVRGVVRDVAGGTISGAVVTDGEHARAVSDDEGEFTLWVLPRSTVAVGAQAPGYTHDVEIVRPPQPPVTLYLTPESILRGRVVRGDAGEPLAGSPVYARESGLPDAETDADGVFEIRGLLPGRHKPFVRSDGWCGGAEPSVVLGIGETSERITIVARPCRSLVARVRVRPGGEGCASAEIELLDAAGDVVRGATTDATGEANLSGLDPGAYSVRIRCPGRLQRAPEPWLLGDAMRTEVTWTVEQGRTVRGVVRDPRGDAVPRANVEISGAWGHVGASVDDRGEFVVAGVHPGPATIRAYHPRRGAGESREIDIPEGSDPSPVVLVFLESSEGVVRGRIQARSGELPPGLCVAAYAIGNLSGRVVRVGPDGSYEISGLSRLPHRVVVQRKDGLSREKGEHELEERVVDLEGREAAEADFVVDVPGMVELSGRVEGPDHGAEADALVTVSDRMTRVRTISDEGGRFSVQVPGGMRYTVEVTARDGTAVRVGDVKPGAAVTVRLTPTRRVCGVVAADVPVTGSYSIDTDVGVRDTFVGVDARWCLLQVPVGARTFKARSQILGAARATVQIPAAGEVPEVALRFAGRTAVGGRVVDGAGQPRAGLKIWIFDVTGRLVGGNHYTDTDGRFSVDGVPAGELTVVPFPAGPMPTREALLAGGTRVSVAAGDSIDSLQIVAP